jgi:hypothetical protein
MNGCGLQQYGWSRRLFFDANMGIHKLSLPKVDCIVLSVRVVAFKVSFCQTRCCLLVSKVFFSVPELGIWTCFSNVLESTSISDQFKVAQLVFTHRSTFFFLHIKIAHAAMLQQTLARIKTQSCVQPLHQPKPAVHNQAASTIEANHTTLHCTAQQKQSLFFFQVSK